MKTLKFKTNINCGGCVAAVTPFLNGIQGIRDWTVDTADTEKILTVTVDGLAIDQVQEIIANAGYKAQPIATEKQSD